MGCAPGTLKALSVHPAWAERIAAGEKTVEVRSWRTRYRGPLLICASRRPNPAGLPAGVAVAVVRVVGCRPMTPADEAAAGGVACVPGAWAWELADARRVTPFAVSGRLGLYDVAVPSGVTPPPGPPVRP